MAKLKMPYFEKSEDWLEKSALLLKARPSTARVTTRYKVRKSSTTNSRRRKLESTSAKTPVAESDTAAPVGVLTLKTYDPVSGTTLKYETQKAQEVGRLFGALARLSRNMAALPDMAEVEMVDVAVVEWETGTHTPVPQPGVKDGKASAVDGKGGQGGGGGGKKKKGKK